MSLRQLADGAMTLHVYLRETDGDGQVSAAALAPTLEPLPRPLLQFVERTAPLASLDDPEPPNVTLLFRALEPLGIADAMLSSSLPAVRLWATRRLADLIHDSETAAGVEQLLWRAALDAHPAVRQVAVNGFLAVPLSLGQVVHLFEALASRPADEGVRALEVLRRGGAPDATLRAAEAALSAARPVPCPECGVLIRRSARPASPPHVDTHGYLDVGGAVQPRAARPSSQLWRDRSLPAAGDREAQHRLFELLTQVDGSGQGFATGLRACAGSATPAPRRPNLRCALARTAAPDPVACSCEPALPVLTRFAALAASGLSRRSFWTCCLRNWLPD